MRSPPWFVAPPRAPRLAVAGLLISLFAGCGSGGHAKTANDLKGLGLMYHEYVNKYARGPAKSEDLKEFASLDPKGYQALTEGRCVLLWNVRLTDLQATPEGLGAVVLGYEEGAPIAGGLVLFGDGSVRALTASDFQRAPKARPAPGSPETPSEAGKGPAEGSR